MKDIHSSLGFRFVYRPIILSGSLTTIFRPNLPKYKKLFPQGVVVSVRIILIPGNEKTNTPPVYTNERLQARIKSITIHNVKDLKPQDFEGSSPDVKDQASLAYHLGLIYNQPLDNFRNDKKIIKIKLEYL